MKHLALFLIKVYEKTISLDHGLPHKFLGTNICRFHPTCSRYTYEAIEKFGIIKGGWLGMKRVCRCHPWNLGGNDPVPEKFKFFK